MEGVKTYLIAVTCAAMVAALAQAVTPECAAGKLVKLAGGVLLLLTVLQPVLGWKGLDLGALAEEHIALEESRTDALEEANKKLMKELIADKSGAYIVDKAAQLGITCRAEVRLGTGEEELLPWEVEVRATLTQTQRRELEELITRDLGIPAQRQRYVREGEE